MKQPSATGVAIAFLGGAGAVAGSFLVAGDSSSFVGAAMSGIVTDVTPGPIITMAITELGDLATTLVTVTALGVAVGFYAAIALASMAVWHRPINRSTAAVAAIGGGWLVTVLLTGAPFGSIATGIPLGLVVYVGSLGRTSGQGTFDPDRRYVGKLATGVAGFGVVSYLLGPRQPADLPSLDLPEEEREAVDSKLADARAKSLDVDTESGLVSMAGDFYEVDINATFNPAVSTTAWELSVTGAVDSERTLQYDDLTSRDPVHRFHTLRCVGERLNAHKMDTALWTGIPMGDLIDEAGPTSDCECVVVRAVDDYFEEFPIEALRRGMLVYGMNGERLPRAHGAPARLVVPGHWGEISVKWVSEIEFLEKEMDGYWEQLGWHGTGPAKTVAKLHAVERREGDTVRVGGHAYAGYRGISAVQVTTDGGDTWESATLSDPLPDDAAWRQWRHDIEVAGPTTVTVRAVEADGTIQPKDETGPFPNGPSGWVSRHINP